MNNTTKTFALVGFTMSLAKDLSENKNEYVAWRASRMLAAARHTGKKYPASQLTYRQAQQIETAVQSLDRFGYVGPGGKNLVEILAFVLTGIDEVLVHTKNPVTCRLFSELAKKALWLNDLVDPRLDQTGDYIRGEFAYMKWAE